MTDDKELLQLNNEIKEEKERGIELLHKLEKEAATIQSEIDNLTAEIAADPNLSAAERNFYLQKIQQQNQHFQAGKKTLGEKKEVFKSTLSKIADLFTALFARKKKSSQGRFF